MPLNISAVGSVISIKKARSPIGTKEVPKTEYCTPIENQQKALILMVFSFDMGNKEVPFNFYITIRSLQFFGCCRFYEPK